MKWITLKETTQLSRDYFVNRGTENKLQYRYLQKFFSKHSLNIFVQFASTCDHL